MVPNFALALLFQGIRLLRRTPEGWALVGEVPLDSPDLAGELAWLRDAGVASGTSWEDTHLLLPPEQIRTLILSGEQGDDRVLAALEGMTPYAVSDLVVDHMAADGRTHVAAVARETLEEAAAFAAAHGFRPLSFGALLDGFPREASFAPARLAAAAGTVAESAASPGAFAREALAPLPLGAEVPSPEVAAPETIEAPVVLDAGPEALSVHTPASGSTHDEAAPSLSTEAPSPKATSATASQASELYTATPADPMTPEAAREGAAVEDAQRFSSAPAGANLVAVTEPDTQPERLSADSAEPTDTLAPKPASASVPQAIVASRVAPLKDATRAPASTLGALEGARKPQGPHAEPSPRKPATPSRTAPVRAEARALQPAGRRLGPSAAAARPAALDAEPAHAPFGSDRSSASPVGGKPRFLGLLLTVLLLVAMAAVAVLSSVSERGLAGLIGSTESVTAAVAPPAAAPPAPPEAAAEPESLAGTPAAPPASDAATVEAAAATVAAAIAGLATPEAQQAPEPTLDVAADARPAVELPAADSTREATGSVPPAEADRVYAATGVWLGAPRLPLLPEASAATPEGADLSALSLAKALAAPPVLAVLGPDTSLAAQFNPPAPGDTLPRDNRGLVLATPEGTRAASGVLLFAGAPPQVPPSRPAAIPEHHGPLVAPEGPQAAKGSAPWANALAEPPSRLPPQRPSAPAEFLAALATPSALALVATEAVADPALAGFRPAPRPSDLSPPKGLETPARILASYDGPRPGPRPDALAPEAPDVSDAVAQVMAEPPAAPAAPDLQATLAAIVQGAPDPLAGATPQAVAVVRVPDARPRNFDQVVQRQLDRVARASQESQRPAAAGLTTQEQAEAGEAQAASAAAAVPTGPTPTSVAAAATTAAAMRLRDINLIGVYGQPGARRALIRTGNGRYLRVGIGEALDGGQVTAIGDNALNYVRRGRTEVLVIPGG